MKCTNCGKNNAVNHYRYEINGQVMEAHLCADCARELQPEREFAAKSREMLGGLLDDGFFGFLDGAADRRRGMLSGLWDPFEGFFGGFSPFAMLGVPRIEISFPEAGERTPSPEERSGVDPELAKRREINALSEQMRQAAESEDYEKAARLRDQLKALEKDQGK